MTIIDEGFPVPQLQVWVLDGARPKYRLDLAYPLLKIAIEYDGEEHHSTSEQRAADLARRAWLRDRGWIVIVVRKDDFTGDSCDRWLAELKAALRERTPVRNRRYSRGESRGRS
jgi:very-short-patch-repair endonuclease